MAAAVILKRPIYARRAGRAVPFALAVIYAAIAPGFFTAAQGGFDSLSNVQLLFSDPWLVLGGWLHWLAADLFIGSWIAGRVMERGWSRGWLIGLLPLAAIVGPIGFLAYQLLVLAFGSQSQRQASQ